MREQTTRIVRESIDSHGIMWREIEYLGPDIFGTLHRAVCRPESCADGHRCGILDLGVVG